MPDPLAPPQDVNQANPTGTIGSGAKELTEVTGFHLFALCHRFGRRGRAFIHSLVNQHGNPFRMNLTIFYCAAEDAKLLREGMAPGNGSLELSLQHVPPERIMQRALHFCSATFDPRCSHLVFLDADLWFPPNFWRNFGDSLKLRALGYWSCTVLNIPLEAVDDLLLDWRSLSISRLHPLQVGRRHDSWKGKVGHFQCIPAGLVGYPRDEIQAVNRADEVFAKAAVAVSADQRDERRIGEVPAYHLDHPSVWTGSAEQL